MFVGSSSKGPVLPSCWFKNKDSDHSTQVLVLVRYTESAYPSARYAKGPASSPQLNKVLFAAASSCARSAHRQTRVIRYNQSTIELGDSGSSHKAMGDVIAFPR